MKKTSISALTFLLLFIFSCSEVASADDHDNFLECLSEKFHNYSSISNVVYTPTNSSYSSVLRFTIWNLRFRSESTPKPQVIITPEHESQIPPIIYCAKENRLEIRIRSGGHDLEGLSYASKVPFAIIDLIKLNEIRVDAEAKTAWVGAGATIGSLYYAIVQKSSTLAFPAGICLSVGLGGYISGGGYGPLMRKYGMAADNVLDARIINANGRIIDRKSMGEDLFWAIRGGGGASFGVIVAWKLQLVDVPEKVTVFRIQRNLEQNATQIIHRWQYVAPKLDRDLWIGVLGGRVNSTQNKRNVTMVASFFSLFLGGVDRLLPLMHKSFPELGLVREDCTEMSWIRSTLFLSRLPIGSPEVLSNSTQTDGGFTTAPLEVMLNRTQTAGNIYMKARTSYVQKPIPEDDFEGIWQQYYEPEGTYSNIYFVPYGGKMDEISESVIPFPHRAGNLYMNALFATWREDENQNSERYISWVRRVYNYMTPYVALFPRSAYLNYRDFDLGVNNNEGKTSYAQASIWGRKYFKNNFDRLVRVKTTVDPHNFFKNEQSIPSVPSKWI